MQARNSAGAIAMPDDEPKTIHEFEMKRRQLEPGAAPVTPRYPKLPPSSPWSVGIDQLTGPEPPLNEET
jgi:hypothetical protein